MYLNGESVSVGPCRGDLQTYYYETIDLTHLLRTGSNILAAKVLHYGAGAPAPAAIISSGAGAFILQGDLTDEDGTKLEQLSTDQFWQGLPDYSLTLLPEGPDTQVGGLEVVEGTAVPVGWETLSDETWPWSEVNVIGDAVEPRCGGHLKERQLSERQIPLPYERDGSFLNVVRYEGIPNEADLQTFERGESPLLLPAGSTAVLELDAGEMMTAYLRFVMEQGSGSEIVFLCAESYETPDRKKGIRDEHEGKSLYGNREVYRVGGNNKYGPETYETFLFRTFRFVRLEVKVGDEPLLLRRIYYRETGYPLELKASFACSDPSYSLLWDISVRTLQRCMYESYVDCPYYEQLQYGMDTRLQCLFTYAISGDDRLARKAIFDFHSSLLPSGMMLSRYPARVGQVIPGFALHWIMMVSDHYEHYCDLALVRRYRPSIDAVLDWFERQTGEDGLVGAMPDSYWSFADWVPEWNASYGVPVTGRSVPLTLYNLMYADALHKAALLNDRTGRGDTASEYRLRAQTIIKAVNSTCWSSDRQFYQDSPGVEEYSQHVQIWAILSGATEGDAAEQLAIQLIEDNSLMQVSDAMAFFLFRALSEAGQYERTYRLWDRWHEQVKLHLTTWVEDAISQRSDCHAWGAVPLYEFTHEIIGVKPTMAGYAAIRIAPQPGPHTWAKGSIVASHGLIQVSWVNDVVNGRFTLQASGLGGKKTEVCMPDGSVSVFENRDEVEVVCGARQVEKMKGVGPERRLYKQKVCLELSEH
ncbi:alpha-L-rhamnosidase C-terminal domain-containing protein [Paenibacillus sp. MY03]|uniref:alpha-L-rhamnosidase-related protein n=1 Tax=Paenibacillus sp. MY03 TaxID=302980 RepID=UPI0015C653B0|nr:alpha-L-rhamnosidase C-terminal domain-containing protein [Paenibacillus sp. MY03]